MSETTLTELDHRVLDAIAAEGGAGADFPAISRRLIDVDEYHLSASVGRLLGMRLVHCAAGISARIDGQRLHLGGEPPVEPPVARGEQNAQVAKHTGMINAAVDRILTELEADMAPATEDQPEHFPSWEECADAAVALHNLLQARAVL